MLPLNYKSPVVIITLQYDSNDILLYRFDLFAEVDEPVCLTEASEPSTVDDGKETYPEGE